MREDTTYVALDDSKRKIVAGILRPGAMDPEVREIANDPGEVGRLFRRLRRDGPVVACYEAGVSGYALHRQLTQLEVPCQVVAPSLTPRNHSLPLCSTVNFHCGGETSSIQVRPSSNERRNTTLKSSFG